MREKITFKILFVCLAIILMLLPLVAALNSTLTNFFANLGWYQVINQYIVPWEARLVAVAIRPLGISSVVTPDSQRSAFYMMTRQGTPMSVNLAWNCLGWQSMLLLVISIIFGLRGNFTKLSRLECLLLGFFGTLLVNVLRMAIVAAGIYYINQVFALVVHDYLVALMTIIWLIFFWWFSFSFVLEEKVDRRLTEHVRMKKG